MKKNFLVLLGLLIVMHTAAQQDFNDSIARSRIGFTRDAMITLGSWAAANIASGFIIAGTTSGEAKYVWRMNGYWNLINLGLAGLGYAGTFRAASMHYGLTDNVKAQQAIEKLYVFNMGLDMLYIAGGFYLRERGKNETNTHSSEQFRGYGTSIAIQGAFLLLMDGVMYSLHHRNTVRVNSKLQRLELSAGPNGLGLNYFF